MKRVWIAAIVAVVAAGIALGPRVARYLVARSTCSGQPSDTFDTERWQRCTGPQRIAMADGLVARHQLIGRSLLEAVAMLGPAEIDKDGDIGWRLGEPEGSPSMYPNPMFLGVVTDRAGGVQVARVIDESEGRPLQ